MLNKITRYLLFVIIIELVVGGGRLVSWGPVSLRMILFALAIVITALHIVNGARVKPLYLNLLFAFTGMLMAGSIVGIFVGADKKFIWEDIKPLLYFYLLPFFSLAIRVEKDSLNVRRIIVTSSVAMAIAYLIILVLINTKVLPFLDFYELTAKTSDYFYRGEYSFYYKGFVYLCVAFIFIYFTRNKNKWWISALLLVSILLTFTRGLVFALSLTYLFYFVVQGKYKHAVVMLILCGVVLIKGKDIYGSISESLYRSKKENSTQGNPALSTKLLGDREFSDNERKKQIRQVVTSITYTTILWGHGFGIGVESRPIHMEISYLEIFHKQGLIGICVWFFLFISLVRSFTSTLHSRSYLNYAFFLSALFFFFQSLTNQYINNPIGMGMFLISIVCLNSIEEKSPIKVD